MSKLQQPSISIETSKHCNLKCAGCDHASPWFETKSLYALETFERDLDALTAVMDIGELVIAGGEPLLHPELLSFLELAKRKRYADGVTLITNGVHLHRAPVALWQLLDGISVSRYPGVRIRLSDDEMRTLGTRHGTAVIIEESSTFKHMLVNDAIDDPRLIRTIFKSCYAAVNCHTVFEGRYFKCSRAHLMSEILAMAGVEFENPADGVDLHAPRLRERLQHYLRDDAPLRACEHCLGSHGRPFAASQLHKIGVAREQQDRTSYRDRLDPAAPRTPEEAEPPPVMGKWWLGEDFVQQTDERALARVTKPS
ncbi:radical SAM protein [Haliangium ochraceum]|uniref:Radical SAM domain protein n=1 Tax=Haliangium ochraceum (strain DSM 14365 / JCM 11303 / SMP-2) TaxID=502025 RepID=D0LTF4_HALO1|nr:radical SAM protein [Haliangium ochraceum]ACY13849.1 Radical SAM domain protein [Haliangium ochraceum DSM 14365]